MWTPQGTTPVGRTGLADAGRSASLALTIGIGIVLPDVSFTTDYGAFLRGPAGLPEEQVEASLAVLEGLPVPPVVFLVGQGLVAGLTINAVAALGEELGWRGLFLRELSPLGFWRLSLLTGAVWDIWHAPLIVQGHNFPDAPVAGIVVMTGWTVAASPLFTYLTVRAKSVLAATLLHGSFNAVASLSLVYLTGAGARPRRPGRHRRNRCRIVCYCRVRRPRSIRGGRQSDVRWITRTVVVTSDEGVDRISARQGLLDTLPMSIKKVRGLRTGPTVQCRGSV